MKIKLAPQLRINVYACCGLSIGYYLCLAYLFHGSGVFAQIEYAPMTLLMVLGGLLPVLLWFPHRRQMMNIFIEENVICSRQFGKVKCQIHTDRETYYSIFESDYLQGVRARGRYIMFSHEPFVYADCAGTTSVPDRAYPSVARYDVTKQIILPYNEQTIPLLPVENWIRLNRADASMKRV